MTTSTTAMTTTIVTPEQVAMCERIIDMTSGLAFYIVKSESYADNYQEYTVKAVLVNGRYFLTCTCQAGMSGTPCKHKRWATAAAQIEKTQVKVEAMSKAPVTVVLPESVPTLIIDDEQADELTYRRVMSKPAKEIDRKAKAPGNNKAFSLLRK